MAEAEHPTPEEARRDLFEATLVERARAVIALAWQVGSGLDVRPAGMVVTNPDRYNATVLNGLVALAMVEVMAVPGEPGTSLYSPLRLSKVLDG